MDSAAGDAYIPQKTINPIINKDEVDVIRDPLTLELDDAKFLQYAKTLKRETDEWWNEKGSVGYNLNKRREINEMMLMGRQYEGEKPKKGKSSAQDNILYEAEAYLKAMALSKLPDITVTPGGDTEEKKKIADLISRVLTPDRKSKEYRDRKRVLGLAFKQVPIDFGGCIKRFWNPQKGRFGDMDAKVVNMKNLTLDYRAQSNDVKDMDFIFEVCEKTVKELVMEFPEKEKDFYEELRKYNIFGDASDPETKNENNEEGMNSKIKYIEVWFKWYDRPEGEKDKSKWEEIIGVAWYFNNCLFRKMKHPYWDWTGTPQTFSFDMKGVDDDTPKKRKQSANLETLKKMALGEKNQETQTETIFHNHLDYPEFPYIFMGMDQWGKTPLDETSRIEQATSLQGQYDKRNRQLDEIIDRSRGKDVFSSSEGLTKDDVANMDMGDTEQKLLIRGSVKEMYAHIAGEQPVPAMFQNIQDDRERLFDKLGVHQATRGQIDSDTAATNNQIARQGDFTRMDDLVDDTINYACEKWANWDMQFMKLFYTEEHLRRILGEDGKWLTVKLHRDFIDDGMEVIISASGSDKLKAEQQAVDNAKMKMTDPYRYFKDTNASDPKGRTTSLMTFLMNPQAYLLDIQNGGDGSSVQNGVQNAAQTVNGASGQQHTQNGTPEATPQGGQPGDPTAIQDIMQIQSGHIPQPPQQVSAAYLATFTAFMHSPMIEELIQKFGPQFKQQLLQFAQAVAELGKQVQQQSGQQPQPQQTPPAPQMGTNSPVGPVSQRPSPANTSRVATKPPSIGV
jgi:hypothetical protein